MNLNDIGYNSIVNKYVEDIGLDKSNIGRVVVVFKDRYIIRTDLKEMNPIVITPIPPKIPIIRAKRFFFLSEVNPSFAKLCFLV